jgi:hypothetical protein
MLTCKYNKDEGALEVVDKLAPKFTQLQQQLSEIADALRAAGASFPPRHEENEVDPAPDHERDRGNQERSLTELQEKLASSEDDKKKAESKIADLQQVCHELRERAESSEPETDLSENYVEIALFEWNVAELDAIRGKLQEAQGNLETSSKEHQQLKEQLEGEHQRNKQEIEALQHEAASTIEGLNSKISVLNDAKAASEAESRANTLKLEQLALENGSLSQDRDALNDQTSQMEQQMELSRKLEALIWPDFMAKPEMEEWKARLENAVHQGQTDENVMVIVASLFNFNAFAGLEDQWGRRLFDVLQDFSRALLAWCESSGLDPEQAASQAKLWAGQFTGKGEGEFAIEVPEPDEPFDQRVMVSYESGTSSGSMDVKAVKSWCIKDGAGRILKQAEVTTY